MTEPVLQKPASQNTASRGPVLQKPGAGLPLFETLAARFFFVPYYSRKSSWEESIERFEKEGQRILKLLAPLSEEQRGQRVLIDRIQGIEDSSRYWSVAMTIEHLMIVGQNCAEGIVLLSAGKTPPHEVRVENVKPKGALKPMELEATYALFMTDYKRTLAERVVDRDSRTTLFHPWLGALRASQWNWLMGTHQATHRKQIQLIIKGLESA